MDEHITDVIGDQKAFNFLKMNDGACRFVQKRLGKCIGPLSKIWEEVDDIENKTESKLNIDELRQFIEKTILIIGQVNVAFLFERRLNYFTEIMLCAKDAKQSLKENEKSLDGVD